MKGNETTKDKTVCSNKRGWLFFSPQVFSISRQRMVEDPNHLQKSNTPFHIFSYPFLRCQAYLKRNQISTSYSAFLSPPLFYFIKSRCPNLFFIHKSTHLLEFNCILYAGDQNPQVRIKTFLSISINQYPIIL